MRITLEIDDELLRQARTEAGARGVSLSAMMEAALRDALAGAAAARVGAAIGEGRETVDHVPDEVRDQED